MDSLNFLPRSLSQFLLIKAIVNSQSSLTMIILSVTTQFKLYCRSNKKRLEMFMNSQYRYWIERFNLTLLSRSIQMDGLDCKPVLIWLQELAMHTNFQTHMPMQMKALKLNFTEVKQTLFFTTTTNFMLMETKLLHYQIVRM